MADEEVQQAEQRKTDAPGLKRERSESVSSQRSDGFMSPTDMKHGKDEFVCCSIALAL